MKSLSTLLLCLIPAVGCTQSTVDIEIIEGPATTILSSGQPLSMTIRARSAARELPDGLGYLWRDFRGRPLTTITPLRDGAVEVTAPSLTHGYLGLAFVATDPTVRFNPSTGLRQEFGFVFVPPDDRPQRNPDSPFGMVHPDLTDPNMPAWVKTLTWNTTSARYWAGEIAARRDSGFHELPLVSGKGWTSDDAENVADAQLDDLSTRFAAYASADSGVRHWELGREENLGRRFEQSAYFDNLERKAAAARRASADKGISPQLIYQVGGRSLTDARKFFASDAARQFDIFAPHPYYWPDFPTPERWLAQFIEDRRAAMRENGLDMPIWITEIGAPQNDAQLPTMYSGKHEVPGHSREENAAYVVKTHAIALANGVEKVFWYNYVDRDPDISDVEEHFGLVDHWGHPKPSYAAYLATMRCIGNKRSVVHDTSGGLQMYRFSDADEHCVIIWSYPQARNPVNLQMLIDQVGDARLTAVFDTVGTPLQSHDLANIDSFPVFLRLTGNRPANEAASPIPD